MSYQSKKNAFTLAELIFSLLVMSVAAVGAINSVFHKDNSGHVKKVALNTFVCNKEQTNKAAVNEGVYDEAIHGCNFIITPEMAKKEMFEIHLIGGGGGASSNLNGENGEERVVYYPSLLMPFKATSKACNLAVCSKCNSEGLCTNCSEGYYLIGNSCKLNFYYRAIIGEGGKTSQNGGQTSLLVMKKENPDAAPSVGDKVLMVLETASGGLASSNQELSMNSTSSKQDCGTGGLYPNKSGNSGEVRIQW